MRSLLGARQVQHVTTVTRYNHLKKQGSNLTSLVALSFPPEFDVLLFDFSPV